MKPTVFFDRDGVLNVDKDYLYKISEFEWQEGAIDAICYLRNLGYQIIVFTNQSGVARGYYSEKCVNILHEFMQSELKKYGVSIDKFYYCPHLPDAEVEAYRKICNCRKPNAGMLEQALQDFSVDKDKSFVVGDKQRDLDAGVKIGLVGYLYQSGDLKNFVQNIIENK